MALGTDGGTFPGSSDWWAGCGGLWSAVFLTVELTSIRCTTGWGKSSNHAAVDFVTNFCATSIWAFLGLDGSIDVSLGGIWSCASCGLVGEIT